MESNQASSDASSLRANQPDAGLQQTPRWDHCPAMGHHIRHFSNADDSLFKTILKNSYHVLYPYLPENQYQHYHLRQRRHNKALIPKTTYLSDRDYIMRMLYKNCLAYCYTLLRYCYHPLCLCRLLFCRRLSFYLFQYCYVCTSFRLILYFIS